jgi:alkylation response protein AidB-like acyl-CoA dehydrogenase
MTHDRATLASQAFDDVGLSELLATDRFSHVDRADVDAAVAEFARFAAEVVAPTDRDGDRIGCRFDPATGQVTTPPGLVSAYRKLVEAGWTAVPFDLAVGGGGFPRVVGVALQEIFASANLGLSLCAALTQSAVELLSRWGTAEQQQRYVPRLLTGEWNGTMWITEPDAGSDVGAIRTTATPRPDGTYALNGTKIFISWGEHDLTDNIVHLVLARTPGSPPGTKGLSLFVVPKHHMGATGRTGEANGVRCASIEHKLGLHSSPTAVMQLDDAVGELVGPEGGGMRAMFTMMNPARLSIGLQGLSVGEAAYAEARAFAAERHQGTRVGGERGISDPIDRHPDVRRMLAQMRASLDAMRLVVYTTALHTDLAASGEQHDRDRAQDMVDLLTPIAKGWVTDLGVEVTSIGLQVHGGMGYIEETSAPQRYRDARIGPIYEGTNGIQAIDLVTRKLTRHDGDLVEGLLAEMEQDAKELSVLGDAGALTATFLCQAVTATRTASDWLRERQATSPEDALAGATPYMGMLGDLVGGWLLARRAVDRAAAEAAGADEALAVARFYALERLATVPGRLATVTGGADRLFV